MSLGSEDLGTGNAARALGGPAQSQQAFVVEGAFLLVAAVVAGLLITIGKVAAAESDPAPRPAPAARRRALPLLPGHR